ncbi:MAG: acyl-CoA thioesterase [Chloroflexi bacterium]|nr:acyl-CoA thioesterase [Chloroflexota bacterium]
MEKYKFHLPLTVRFAETDLQGHVFFGHYLTYFDEALTGYMHAIGCTYKDLVEVNTDLYYIRTECDFKSEAFFEDVLNVHARVGQIGNSSLPFEFAAFKAQNDELVATGKIISVTVDLKTKKPVRVPEVMRAAVARYEEKGE